MSKIVLKGNKKFLVAPIFYALSTIQIYTVEMWSKRWKSAILVCSDFLAIFTIEIEGTFPGYMIWGENFTCIAIS